MSRAVNLREKGGGHSVTIALRLERRPLAMRCAQARHRLRARDYGHDYSCSLDYEYEYEYDYDHDYDNDYDNDLAVGIFIIPHSAFIIVLSPRVC